jgi:hypothetical protein
MTDEKEERLFRRNTAQMRDAYQNYLQQGRKLHCPREAHLFALAMRLKGETFRRTVAEVVVELEGELPSYWTESVVAPS